MSDINEIIRDRKVYGVPFSSVVLALHDGRLVLSVSRRDSTTDWGLPGGKLELVDLEGPDELYRAAVRELYEETGCSAESLIRLGNFPYTSRRDGSTVMVATYLALGIQGPPVAYDITPREEGIRIRWSYPHELADPACTFADFNARLFRLVGLST